MNRSWAYSTAILLLYIASLVWCQSEEKCNVVFDIDICDPTRRSTQRKKCDHLSDQNVPNICRKPYVIDFVKLEPYTPEIVIDSLKTCCGPCLTHTLGTTYTTIAELPHRANMKSHFVFPVLGRKTAR